MKRLVMISLALMLNVAMSYAQTKLNISVFFKDNSPYAADSKMVWVEGRELKPYKLTLYRSITAENKQTVKDIEEAVVSDSKQAADKEIGYIGQRLYYAFLSFAPTKLGSTVRRYVFYRNAALKSTGKKDATLVYMEGQVSMDELKKLFK